MLKINPLISLGRFWEDKNLSLIFRWTLTFVVLQVGLIILKYQSLPRYVPFYYSLPWGEAQLAPSDYLFILPSISFFFLLLNNLLAAAMMARVKLFGYLLSVFALICSVFLFYSLLQIILLIT